MNSTSAPTSEIRKEIDQVFNNLATVVENYITARVTQTRATWANEVFLETQCKVIEQLDQALEPLGISLTLQDEPGEKVPRIHVNGPQAAERMIVTAHDEKGRILETVKTKVPAALAEEVD